MSDRLDDLMGNPITRRELMKKAGIGAGGVMMASVIAACGGSTTTTTTGSSGTSAATTAGTTATTAAPSAGTIKIGFVSPRTGPAAAFGEPDPYVIGLAKTAFAKGLTVGGKTYAVQIIDKDGQANPQRSAEVAQELINSDKVDLMLATSTPETTNPVADACEAAGIPCVSTVCPWEAWYFGRGAKQNQPSPFKYTYHFSFGVNEFYKAYTSLWPQVPTNKKVGVMWPNDADGNAIRAALGPMLTKAGYTIVDPGAYQDGTNDYSAQISQFKSQDCQIFQNFSLPPDFATFWRQAAQQGYKPKIAQLSKAGLFPSEIEALGPIGYNLAESVYWAPVWPYKSSLTGQASQQLGDGYTSSTKKQWTQQLGPSTALFDVANAVLIASGDPLNKDAVANAFKTLKVDTIIGSLAWGTGPVPNVVATAIQDGQWTKGTTWPVEWVACENANDAQLPTTSKLQPFA
jgi:branched-chain amino acid transport system substrate-binding protein